MNGFHKAMNGLREAMNGFHEAMNGICKAMIGLREAMNGFHEAMNGLRKAMNGLREAMNGFHEAMNGLHEADRAAKSCCSDSRRRGRLPRRTAPHQSLQRTFLRYAWGNAAERDPSPSGCRSHRRCRYRLHRGAPSPGRSWRVAASLR